MHVLLTPDRFAVTGLDRAAGHLPGERTRRVGAALVEGWLRGAGQDTVDLCPLSDGGPGFTSLLAQACGWAGHIAGDDGGDDAGDSRPDGAAGDLSGALPGALPGALLGDLPAGVLMAPGTTTAYIDSAVALAAHPRDGSAPVAAQIEWAIAAGATRVVVGLGTPADLPGLPDAGAGLLAALGVRGLDVSRSGPRSVDAAGPGGGAQGGRPHGVAQAISGLRGVDLVVAAATDIPLLGLHGACAGAADAGSTTREAAQRLEREIGELSDLLWQARERETAGRRPGLLALASGQAAPTAVTPRARDLTSLPGAGAGGGLGFALALLGARLMPGAAVYAQAVGLADRARAADLVVAARDDLDGASFHGSGIEQAALAASGLGIACVALAERTMMNRRELAAVGLSASYPLRADGDGDGDPSARTAVVTERVARSWSPSWAAPVAGPGL